MKTEDWFFNKLVELQNDYRRLDKVNREMLAAAYEGRAKDVETRERLIHDLCRALERAQEIIVMIGEKSGNEELLAEAKVYANAVGSLNEEFGPNPTTHYSENPIIQKHWEIISANARRKDK